MSRAAIINADFQSSWRRIATLFGAVGAGALSASAWVGTAIPAAVVNMSRGAGPLLWGALLTAMLFAVGLIGFMIVHARAMRQHQALADALRAARARLHCVEELLDVWQWQTDRDHQLVALRPPHGALSGNWTASAQATPLWEHFKITDEAALRARLVCAAPLDDVEVLRTDSVTRTSRRAQLRGRACIDTMGGFAGYLGTLREIEDIPALAPTSALPSSTSVTSTSTSTSTSIPTPLPPPTTLSDHESFTYTVSHDLRAPIRVVEGFTKIIKEDYGSLLDRVGNDHLDRVLGAAARMSNMIDALLALSKLSSQPLTRQPVNLSQLAAYIADDLRRQWPERSVTLVIEPGMLVQGDPTLLRVVLENLLANAWKYTGKSAQPQVWFERSTQQADSYTVRDNGAGFDMRFADRLFGVFQRLHSANDFPGTGVGLASVRRIVRRHDGDIWGEAEVNRGAQFHFSLPRDGASGSAGAR